MLRITLASLLYITLSINSSFSQTTGVATAKGNCNVANSGNNSRTTINCRIGVTQGKQMVEILNKILANEIEPSAVMMKLDEILAIARKPAQIVNAPNGIGTIGGTLYNPTVNNFGPPPAILTFTEKDVTDVASKRDGYNVLEVHIKTDRSIPGAIIGIVFSGPANIGKETMDPDIPKLNGASIQQLSWGQISKAGIPIPNSFGITVNAPAAFMPGMELILKAKSIDLVHVLEVAPLQP